MPELTSSRAKNSLKPPDNLYSEDALQRTQSTASTSTADQVSPSTRDRTKVSFQEQHFATPFSTREITERWEKADIIHHERYSISTFSSKEIRSEEWNRVNIVYQGQYSISPTTHEHSLDSPTFFPDDSVQTMQSETITKEQVKKRTVF